MENKNFINVYDGALEPNQCQHLIDKFEDSKHQWTKTELKGHRSFTEININLHSDWQEYVDIIYKVLRPYVDKYCEDNDVSAVYANSFEKGGFNFYCTDKEGNEVPFIINLSRIKIKSSIS